MRGILGKLAMIVIGLTALAACSQSEPKLMNIRDDTPDEFSIRPTKPLEAPDSYTELPTPTPNGTNRVDKNPFADAVSALGGDPARVERGAIYAGEQTLVSHARQYATTANIRETVAEEDLEYRRKNNGKLLERLFSVNVYYGSYAKQSLDQHRELDRLRKAGVWTPTAPPDPERY
ncbi:MAG: DUF3035 domain-containing protein [Maritimibacter sp.]